jgi:hypothetical protein
MALVKSQSPHETHHKTAGPPTYHTHTTNKFPHLNQAHKAIFEQSLDLPSIFFLSTVIKNNE